MSVTRFCRQPIEKPKKDVENQTKLLFKEKQNPIRWFETKNLLRYLRLDRRPWGDNNRSLAWPGPDSAHMEREEGVPRSISILAPAKSLGICQSPAIPSSNKDSSKGAGL